MAVAEHRKTLKFAEDTLYKNLLGAGAGGSANSRVSVADARCRCLL